MEPKRSSDIDLLTLAIAAAAAMVAAYLTSQVWAGGTLVSAALTPVIVALVKEGLARPVDKVQTFRGERRTGEQPQIIDPTRPDQPYITVYGRGESSRRWKVAIVSGLAAFALVVAVFTLPELVAGKSIGRSGDGAATTFFGGQSRKAKKKARRERSKPAPGAAAPEATATAEADETATPEATETPEATATATPTPTPSVAATPTPTP